MAIIETEHLRRQPRRNMHTICDVPDWNIVFQLVAEQSSPHGAGYFGMQRRYRIGAPREPQRQHGHAKQLITITGVLAAQPHETFLGKSQSFSKRTDVLFDQTGVEAIVPRRHWSMRGEDNFAGDTWHR